MEENWTQCLREARSCHTKTAWDQFLSRHYDVICASNTSRPIAEIFKILQSDPQALQYAPELWSMLMEGCLASWDLDLGKKIADYTQAIASSVTGVSSAKIYIESGLPQKARRTASRAARLININSDQKLQLEMITARSYVEEGKRPLAVRLLNRMETSVNEADLSPGERAAFLMNMARINFFLGRYQQSGQLFYDSFQIYKEMNNWEQSARAVYNAGSSFFNAGDKCQDKAFKLVEECRRISEAHQLHGPLSFVESFYGHDDYWHGNFAGARDHYRRAHKYLPSHDGGFRTLHVISMLALIYLRTGQLKLAQKFGDKTLELAAKDKSHRFVSRYFNLKAELMWEAGQIEESQDFLREHCQLLYMKGANTLEELSTFSRYLFQCSKLGETSIPTSVKVSEQLKKNTGEWIEFKYAHGQFQLAQGNIGDAKLAFEGCIQRARQYGDRYHHALGLLGMIQVGLQQRKGTAEISSMLQELEIALGRMVEIPLRAHTFFVYAAIAYREGDFAEVARHLKAALKLNRISMADRFVATAWLATAQGRSPRLTTNWQERILAHATRTYFLPTLERQTDHRYQISEHYIVDLERHPALSEFLNYLMQRNRHTAKPSEIQSKVWKQSLSAQGWRQKIRNNIMRIRDLFPYTMAPLIIHNEYVKLNSEAIAIVPAQRKNSSTKSEILRLLREGPLSSVQLSNHVNVSQATTKRILKKLTEEERITMMKVGRKVFYQSIH